MCSRRSGQGVPLDPSASEGVGGFHGYLGPRDSSYCPLPGIAWFQLGEQVPSLFTDGGRQTHRLQERARASV
jgi:hypothetical protein